MSKYHSVKLTCNKATKHDMQEFLDQVFKKFNVDVSRRDVSLNALSNFQVGELREMFEEFMFCSVTGIEVNVDDTKYHHAYDLEPHTSGSSTYMEYGFISEANRNV